MKIREHVEAVLFGHMEIIVVSNVHATEENQFHATQSTAHVSVRLDGMVPTVT